MTEKDNLENASAPASLVGRLVIRIEDMPKKDALKFLAEKERDGSLLAYIKKQYPQYIDAEGNVMSFMIINDFALDGCKPKNFYV